MMKSFIRNVVDTLAYKKPPVVDSINTNLKMSTLAQRRVLINNGYTLDEAKSFSCVEASHLITQIIKTENARLYYAMAEELDAENEELNRVARVADYFKRKGEQK